MTSFPTLPQSRIKRIAKFDPDVNMINAEATLALTAAAEAFICELSKAVYLHASASKRKTIQMKDFEDCLQTNRWLEFLDDALIGWDTPDGDGSVGEEDDKEDDDDRVDMITDHDDAVVVEQTLSAQDTHDVIAIFEDRMNENTISNTDSNS